MRRALILAILAFACGFLSARDLRGRIVDEAGEPLGWVVVSDGVRSVQSNRGGSFQIFTLADSIRFSRIGLIGITLAADKLPNPVVMRQDPLPMPTVLVKAEYMDAFYSAPDIVSVPVDPDRHYYSAGQLLEGSAGVDASSSALKGESQNVRILGSLPRHSLVLLDGVPLNSSGESFDLSLLDMSAIERVEIVKNNASVYGGGSAIGGVVLITTKRAATTGYQYSSDLEVGSFGYSRAGFNIRGTLPKLGWWLSIAKFSADNDFPYKMPPWWGADSTYIRENNAKSQNSLSAGCSFRGKNALLTAQTDYEGFIRQLPGTVNFADVYRYASLEGFSSRSRISLESASKVLNARLLAWYHVNASTYDNTRAPLPVYEARYRQRTIQSGTRISVDKAWGEWQMALAAETGRESFLNRDLLSASDEASYSGDFSAATARLSWERDGNALGFTASAAARFDSWKRQENLCWRAEASISQHAYLESKAGLSLGTSFSRPSPYDLFWKGDSQAIGNPALTPERSEGGQLWAQTTLNALTLRAAIHQNQIQQLIQWRQVQMNGIAWKPFNIGKARIRNLEADLSWQPGGWFDLSARALFTQALDVSVLPADSAPRLMYTPSQSIGAKATIGTTKLRVWASYSHTGKQWTTPDNLTDPLKPFSILDAGIEGHFRWMGWDLSPHFTLRNIADSAYEVYPWVPQPGRTFYAGISARGKW